MASWAAVRGYIWPGDQQRSFGAPERNAYSACRRRALVVRLAGDMSWVAVPDGRGNCVPSAATDSGGLAVSNQSYHARRRPSKRAPSQRPGQSRRHRKARRP